MENPIKSVIVISKFLFDPSPSHQVTLGLKVFKGYTSPKTVYDLKMYFDHNQSSNFTHNVNFDLISTNDVFATVSLIRLS